MDLVKGINERLEDANILRVHGRLQGALLSALVAVAASSRIANPKMKDREAFECYLEGTALTRIKVEFRGSLQPLTYIFYKWLRCTLVHEATLPIDIAFVENDDNGLFVRAGGAPSFVLQLSKNWIDELCTVVRIRTVSSC